MMPLALNNSAISKSIREKKKKMLTSEPEIVDTDPRPDLDANDLMDIKQAGRIEDTLMSEDKIDADLTSIDSEDNYSGVGISPDEMKRMARLKVYMDKMDMSW